MKEPDVPAGARMDYSPIGALDYLEVSRARLEDRFRELQVALQDAKLRILTLEKRLAEVPP